MQIRSSVISIPSILQFSSDVCSGRSMRLNETSGYQPSDRVSEGRVRQSVLTTETASPRGWKGGRRPEAV